jgi:hypothetical protein
LHVYNCTVLGIHFWSILMGDLSWLVWKRLACMKRSCIFLSLWSGRSVFSLAWYPGCGILCEIHICLYVCVYSIYVYTGIQLM